MKRIFCIAMAMMVLSSMSACASVSKEEAETASIEATSTETADVQMELPIESTSDILSEENESEGKTDMKPVFNFETKTVKLNSGYDMPIMGLGTYALEDGTCVNSVTTLLENGGRLIDTASFYGTEDSVGEAIAQSSVPREEIFVTTKLYPNQYSNAAQAIDDALAELNLEYIDLMLLHHPASNDVDAYKVLEQAVTDGKIRSLGLSNYYIEELPAFLKQASIPPAVVQNEIHPYYQETEVVPFIQSYEIVVEGWFPFGGRGHTSELLNDSVIKSIAEKRNVSSAQVILRWNLQRGVVVIPGSSNPEHIKENLNLFGFELTEEEMKLIGTLNRDEKHEWY